MHELVQDNFVNESGDDGLGPGGGSFYFIFLSTVDENTIATPKIRNNYTIIQSLIFLILR